MQELRAARDGLCGDALACIHGIIGDRGVGVERRHGHKAQPAQDRDDEHAKLREVKCAEDDAPNGGFPQLAGEPAALPWLTAASWSSARGHRPWQHTRAMPER